MTDEILNQIAEEALEASVKEMEIETLNEIGPFTNDVDSEPEESKVPEEESPEGKEKKAFSTKIYKGYSLEQMKCVYRHCKNRDLYIAKPVLDKMYEWAGKYEAETDSTLEELRQAACKTIVCVFMKEYKTAQKKVRFIESVLNKLAA